MAEDGNVVDQSPYQTELKVELNKLNTDEYVHAARLLNEEVKRVGAGEKYRVVPTLELHHTKPSSNAVKVTIPVKQFPNYNFVGKLLGPKGNTLKQLQQETLCKLSILGKGSMRDKNKEEELRKEGGKYAHLNEELHVMIECFAETVEAYNRIAHAVTEIKKFMVPTMDDPEGRQMPLEEGGFFNGDRTTQGRGGRMLPSHGAPAGRGGLLSTPGGLGGPGGAMGSGRGAPASRGGQPVRGAAARGAPAPRGVPARGAPAARGAATRGAMATRGVPPQRGLAPQRGTALARGAGTVRGAAQAAGPGAPQRGMLGARGVQSQRGRSGLQSMAPAHQALVQDYDEYGLETGLGAADYEAEPIYGQESRYDDVYSRRSLYADEPAYEEPILSGGDTQYFDYGHGAGASDYQDYEPVQRSAANGRGMMKQSDPYFSETTRSSVVYDRGLAKSAPMPSRSVRGANRSHPYDAGRPMVSRSRFGH